MIDESPQPIRKRYKIQEGKRGQTFRLKKIDIAIIGMACRFPSANNYEEFWELLKNGKSNIQEIPAYRWDWRKYWGDPLTEENKCNSKWGGFIKNIRAFDHSFFNLSVNEVESMDPQQRIMLELSWSCFEDAGIRPSSLSGQNVGVFIGAANVDYRELPQNIEAYYAIGNAHSAIPNRISYYYNFKGPSIPYDTACSSSLFAMHSAIQSILLGECSMALAGGVNLLLTPPLYISFAKMGLLSPTGSCKTFDESADGIVRGEGAGLILLKPLDKAIDDGDYIYGILKGSAINHSGKTYTFTYPNPEAQAEVITKAFKKANITPDSVSYIETHGTGAPKGDPLEIQGLLKAFHEFSGKDGQKLKKSYCGLSSVKTNFGHLESAAGIASVIKVILAMKHKKIPGLQNFKRLNHRISIENSPFYIVDHLDDWKSFLGEDDNPLPLRAGISAFGLAGTNAHIVLEEFPEDRIRLDSIQKYAYLICLSAKTEEALWQKEYELILWLENKGRRKNDLVDISATLLVGREHFKFRAAYVVSDIRELREKLKQVLEKGWAEGYLRTNLSDSEKSPSDSNLIGQQILIKIRPSNVSQMIYRKNLLVLADLYVKGADLDWKLLFDKKIHRINLPSYPFTKELYWIRENNGTESNQIFYVSILNDKIARNDYDVFLCHNNKDKFLVKEIGEKLEKNAILPWLDERELRPGLPWQKNLEEKINMCKSIAVFIGKNGIGEGQKTELQYIKTEYDNRGCPVIPVILDDYIETVNIPDFLKDFTRVDFRKKEPDPLKQLIWGINGKRKKLNELNFENV